MWLVVLFLLVFQLVVVDVYNGRFHRVYYDNDSLHSIMDRDDIYLYVLCVCVCVCVCVCAVCARTCVCVCVCVCLCCALIAYLLFRYELQKPLGDPDWVPVPVYQRELK